MCNWGISQNCGGEDETCGLKTSALSFQIVTRNLSSGCPFCAKNPLKHCGWMTKIMKSEIPPVSAILDPENPSGIGMKTNGCRHPGWANICSCYFRSFVFPNIPVLLWGDQLGAATDASRMLAGQLPYRDYFELLTPAVSWSTQGYSNYSACRYGYPNLTMACLAAATALLISLCARRIVTGPWSHCQACCLWVSFFTDQSMQCTIGSAHCHPGRYVGLAQGSHVLPRRCRRSTVWGGSELYSEQGRGSRYGPFGLHCLQLLHHSPKATEVWRKCLLLCGMSLAGFRRDQCPLHPGRRTESLDRQRHHFSHPLLPVCFH